MANMSYCRFENTLSDLRDCEDNLSESSGLDSRERNAREDLIETCRRIVRLTDEMSEDEDDLDEDEDDEDTDPETPDRYQ